MNVNPRRLAGSLVFVVSLLLLAVPALVFVETGLISIGLNPAGKRMSQGVLNDHTSPLAWTALAVVYVVWVLALVVASVWTLDRLGYHYAEGQRRQEPRKTRRQRRREMLRGRMDKARAQSDERRAAEAASKKAAAGDRPPRKKRPPGATGTKKSGMPSGAGRTARGPAASKSETGEKAAGGAGSAGAAPPGPPPGPSAPGRSGPAGGPDTSDEER